MGRGGWHEGLWDWVGNTGKSKVVWCETDKEIQMDWDGTKTDVWFRCNSIWLHVGSKSSQFHASRYSRRSVAEIKAVLVATFRHQLGLCVEWCFLSAPMTANFSATDRLDRPVVFWYSVAFFWTSHLISKLAIFSCRNQTCFDRPVLLWYFSWWELNCCLKVCAVRGGRSGRL